MFRLTTFVESLEVEVCVMKLAKKLEKLVLPTRGPNGSKADWKWITIGAILSRSRFASELQVVQAELAANPDDRRCRLMLLGYVRELAWEDNHIGRESFAHVVWMINNHPGDYISGHLGFLGDAGNWTAKQVRRAEEAWLAQVKKHTTNRIIFNAALFFDGEQHRKLLKRSKLADPDYAMPRCRLALSYKALAKWGPVKNRMENARRAFVEAESAFRLRIPGGEREGMLQEFTRLAIQFGETELAMRWARKLLRVQNPLYQDYANLQSLAEEEEEEETQSAFGKISSQFSEEPADRLSCRVWQ